MPKKIKQPDFYSATGFAAEMKINRTTALAWLRKGIIPGAVLTELTPGFFQWKIPREALEMPRPVIGWRKGRSRKPVAKPARKPRKGGAVSK